MSEQSEQRTASSTQRGRTRMVLSLLLIVAVVLASGALYVWQRHQIEDLHQRLTTLQHQPTPSQSQQPASPAPQTSPSTVSGYTSRKGIQVYVYVPTKDSAIHNPLGIVGRVPGNWSFEASFPIVLKDSTERVIARGTGQLLGDWMTDQLVPFSAKLTYTEVVSGTGSIELQKDNPSGLAANDDTVIVPIRF